METEHLKLRLIQIKPRTKVYLLISKYSNEVIGRISWYPHWRRYVSEMRVGVVVDSSCHKEISVLLDKLMDKRK